MAARVHQLARRVASSDLVGALGLARLGEDCDVGAVAALGSAVPGCLGFCAHGNPEQFRGSVLIARNRTRAPCTLISDNPRLDFIRALLHFELLGVLRVPGMPPQIHPTASIGRNVVIEDDCIIGEGTVILHNAVIHRGTRIGARVRIGSNASIGGEGFGFERDNSGEPIRFPHLGSVRIGAGVEVGSGACIARGTLDDTVIDDFAKIDNLVQVAHNCRVGRGAMLASGANLSGGVSVGAEAWVGPQACIIQNVDVGERALVGMGAVVLRAIPAGCVYAGNPAKFLRQTDESA